MDDDPLNDICTVKQFADKYPHFNFTKERLYFLLRHKEKNGIHQSGGVVRVGREYMLKRKEFHAWYYKHINIYGREG